MGCKQLKIEDYFKWLDDHLPCRVRKSSKVNAELISPDLENPKNPGFSFIFPEKSPSFVPEKFYYEKKAYSGFFEVPIDSNGNMTSDGTWTYSWNEENRLSSAIKTDDTKVEFVYDGMGRRRVKKVYSWVASAWSLTSETRFVYDGNNLVAELDGSNTVQKTHTWGLDLTGSLTASGGVGALLATNDGTTINFPYYDANGNITAYIDSSDNVTYSCNYSPFGKAIEETGTKPALFGFSTKPYDAETGLNYYRFRYYNPNLGRWINRDSIMELGGENLYCFVLNNPVFYYDNLGMVPAAPFNKFGKLFKNLSEFAENSYYAINSWWIKIDYTNFSNYLNKFPWFTHPCPSAAKNQSVLSGTGKYDRYKYFTLNRPILKSAGENALGLTNATLGGDSPYGPIEFEEYKYIEKHTYHRPYGGYYPKHYKVPFNIKINWQMGRDANLAAMAGGAMSYARPESLAKIEIRVDTCNACWDATFTQYGGRSHHNTATTILRTWYKDLGITPPF